MTTKTYLPKGLPAPLPTEIDAPFWAATRRHQLVVQRCKGCGRHRFGPEIVCYVCRSFDAEWREVEPSGRIFSWQRVWHPVHPALKDACPYVVVLVELPHADNVRIVGNLLGDPRQDVRIDAPVVGVFEDHAEFTLLQWQCA